MKAYGLPEGKDLDLQNDMTRAAELKTKILFLVHWTATALVSHSTMNLEFWALACHSNLHVEINSYPRIARP